MKLKMEFQPQIEKEDLFIPRRNQVVPKQMYPKIKANVYKYLDKKKEDRMIIKSLNDKEKKNDKKEKENKKQKKK